ncbi:hypothetical protein SLS62_008066 [Diatrype stigma]|uniref:EthD domain-containing protein n=1 Tax=Diatrype stigma TaxID=117547 RepID=A0AAN9UMC5_9PEZI
MASKEVLKVDVHHYKLSSVSDETFEKWFHEELTPKWIILVKKHNVLRYTATYTPPRFRNELGPQLDMVRPGWKISGSDVTLTYYVRDIDDLRALLGDPEYQKRGRESEEGFIDSTKGELHVGWETVYFEDGEIKNTVAEE